MGDWLGWNSVMTVAPYGERRRPLGHTRRRSRLLPRSSPRLVRSSDAPLFRSLLKNPDARGIDRCVVAIAGMRGDSQPRRDVQLRVGQATDFGCSPVLRRPSSRGPRGRERTNCDVVSVRIPE
jgi:hypothetical protein